MRPHSISNFEISKFYQNETKVGSVYSRNNLPKIKDEVYVTNLGKYNQLELIE